MSVQQIRRTVGEICTRLKAGRLFSIPVVRALRRNYTPFPVHSSLPHCVDSTAAAGVVPVVPPGSPDPKVPLTAADRVPTLAPIDVTPCALAETVVTRAGAAPGGQARLVSLAPEATLTPATAVHDGRVCTVQRCRSRGDGDRRPGRSRRRAQVLVLEKAAADDRGGTSCFTGASCSLPLAERSRFAWSREYGATSTKSRRRGNDRQKRVSAAWEKKGFAR